ncbi:MAG: hypothetical protein AB7I27_10755 [Bacteriovoracaceae bacterium]
MLAHHIIFDDNKLMINKIKDFLKTKFSRKKSLDVDQSDETPSTQEQTPIADRTRQIELSPEVKEKLSQSSFKEKLTNINFKFWKKDQDKKPEESTSGVNLISPSLSKGIEKLLNRSSRESIHQLALILLISASTYTAGKITALVLSGTPTVQTPKQYTVNVALDKDFNVAELSRVRSINIFKTNVASSGKKKIADTKCEEAQQDSTLPIKLINTVVLQDTVKSLASVQIRGDRDTSEVRVGDQISNLAKIFKITRLELLVKNLETGVCESISSEKMREARSPISVMSPAASRAFKLNKKLPGIENVGNKFNISKNLLDEKLKDIASVLTQVKALKIQNPDGTLAFKLTEMDPEGIFPYLGLQDQDIITSINGKPIYDFNEVMTLFARIKNLDSLQLGVKREGSDSLQEYSIKK